MAFALLSPSQGFPPSYRIDDVLPLRTRTSPLDRLHDFLGQLDVSSDIGLILSPPIFQAVVRFYSITVEVCELTTRDCQLFVAALLEPLPDISVAAWAGTDCATHSLQDLSTHMVRRIVGTTCGCSQVRRFRRFVDKQVGKIEEVSRIHYLDEVVIEPNLVSLWQWN